MADVMATGFADFDRWSLLYRRTLELLDRLATEGDLPAGGPELLATQALPHVEDMETGFRLWLRTGPADAAELRAMVARAGVAPEPVTAAERTAALIEAMQRVAGNGGAPDIQAPPVSSLAALELARLVFALLPSTPAEDVHFPAGRRSYADILPPRRPAELVERIEELEVTLWRAATGAVPRLTDGRYRRTYGFFDAAVRLVGRGFMLS
jgi:hypothetical protein